MSKAQGLRHVNLKALEGPEGLLCAVIKQVLSDAKHPRPTATRPTSATPTFWQQLEAIETLVDGTAIHEFAALIGLDGQWLHAELLRAAGLIPGTPRLGQRRRQRPATSRTSISQRPRRSAS